MKEKVIDIIKELQPNVEITEVGLDLPFDDFGLDSLDVMEIIIEIESKFEINIEDCEVNKTNSINDLIKVIGIKKQEV